MIKLFYANIFRADIQHRVAAFQYNDEMCLWAYDSDYFHHQYYSKSNGRVNNLMRLRGKYEDGFHTLDSFALVNCKEYFEKQITYIEALIPTKENDIKLSSYLINSVTAAMRLVYDYQYRYIPLHRLITGGIRKTIFHQRLEELDMEHMIVID